jgi:hypothetical protein
VGTFAEVKLDPIHAEVQFDLFLKALGLVLAWMEERR